MVRGRYFRPSLLPDCLMAISLHRLHRRRHLHRRFRLLLPRWRRQTSRRSTSETQVVKCRQMPTRNQVGLDESLHSR